MAIWLHDESARLFLVTTATSSPEGEVSGWFVVGTIMERQAPIGLWVDIAYVEERRTYVDGTRKTIRYDIKPSQCVVRWEYIIKVQLLKEAETPSRTLIPCPDTCDRRTPPSLIAAPRSPQRSASSPSSRAHPSCTSCTGVFDSWRGIGDIVAGMARHGYQVSLGDHGAGPVDCRVLRGARWPAATRGRGDGAGVDAVGGCAGGGSGSARRDRAVTVTLEH